MQCFVCKKPATRICDARDCLSYVEKLTIGDYVVERLRTQPAESLCHLQFAFMAFHSHRWKLIAHPFPASYDDVEPIRKTLPIVLRGALDDWMDFLKATPNATDKELSIFMGKDLFVIVKFILMTAPTIKLVGGYENVTLFSVRTPTKIARPFYHGSNGENWYSIIRNGVKVCSGTKWELNGSCHGSGVYLSNSLGTSAGYCRSEQNIIGVYEWKNPNSGVGAGIFVAKNPDELSLCYLIVYRGSFTAEQQLAVEKKIKL